MKKGIYTIQVMDSGLCLDVAGWSKENHANVQQWDCHGGENQQFRRVYQDIGYTIQSVHSGKCLDIAGWDKEKNGNVQMWPCHGGENQIFHVRGGDYSFAPYTEKELSKVQLQPSGECKVYYARNRFGGRVDGRTRRLSYNDNRVSWGDAYFLAYGSERDCRKICKSWVDSIRKKYPKFPWRSGKFLNRDAGEYSWDAYQHNCRVTDGV